jgi:predicted nucleic acid-binding Zn ribbon protein
MDALAMSPDDVAALDATLTDADWPHLHARWRAGLTNRAISRLLRLRVAYRQRRPVAAEQGERAGALARPTRAAAPHVPGAVLSAYVDDDLPAKERRQVEGHLSDCPACRVAVQDYRRTGVLVRSLPVQQVPEGLAQDVWRRLRAG